MCQCHMGRIALVVFFIGFVFNVEWLCGEVAYVLILAQIATIILVTIFFASKWAWNDWLLFTWLFTFRSLRRFSLDFIAAWSLYQICRTYSRQIHWLAKETQLEKIFSKLSSKKSFEWIFLGPSVPCMTTTFTNALLNPPGHRFNDIPDQGVR